MNEINILIGDIRDGDKDLFFGPVTAYDSFSLFEKTTLLDLLVKFNFFTSKSQARKNGWDKPISDGFTDLFIGKKKRRLTILKNSNKFI